MTAWRRDKEHRRDTRMVDGGSLLCSWPWLRLASALASSQAKARRERGRGSGEVREGTQASTLEGAGVRGMHLGRWSAWQLCPANGGGMNLCMVATRQNVEHVAGAIQPDFGSNFGLFQ
jgi:hypothetical protein